VDSTTFPEDAPESDTVPDTTETDPEDASPTPRAEVPMFVAVKPLKVLVPAEEDACARNNKVKRDVCELPELTSGPGPGSDLV
jgi:hypothetical protein